MAFGPSPPPIQVHLCVKGGEAAIAFYEKGFDAVCTFKQMAEDGKRLLHANIAMYGGEIMMHDEFPEHSGKVRSPLTLGGVSVTININLPHAPDVDSAVKRAADAGASVVMPPDNMFWGARYGQISDPFGHIWAFNAPIQST